MRVAIFLGHPAHFHLYKNVANQLMSKGHEVDFVIKQKDILELLLKSANFKYFIIRKEERKVSSKLGLLISVVKLEWNMLLYIIKRKPKLITGTYLSFTGWLTNTPTIICNEDDASVVPNFARLSYPLANDILNPTVCDSGKWDKKAIKYLGFQKLAYLHPNQFTPQREIVEKYFSTQKPYFLLRFAKLNAHHDSGIHGINTEIAQKLIDILNPYGEVYITSERELEAQFESYRLNINPLDIHHVLAFATMYIGDSQSMSVEAAMLGVPSIRFSDFAGKIGVLEELELKYKLTFGIKSSEKEKLYKLVQSFLINENLKQDLLIRQQIMLKEKIDVTAFLSWFIESYPESSKIMKDNPDYQYNFR